MPGLVAQEPRESNANDWSLEALRDQAFAAVHAVKADDNTVSTRRGSYGDMKRTKKVLSSYPEELLHRIIEFFPQHPYYAPIVAQSITHGEAPHLISEYMRYMPTGPIAQDSTEVKRALIRALHLYPELPEREDYGTAEGELYNLCVHLITVASFVDDHLYTNNMDPDSDCGIKPSPMDPNDRNSPACMRVWDEELVELIFAHPDKTEAFCSTIIRRNTIDVNILREVVQLDATPLAEGAL